MSYGAPLPIEESSERRRIMELVPGASDPEALSDDLLEISRWLHAGLDQRGDSLSDGPIDPDLRKKTKDTLKKLAKNLAAAIQSINSLDGLAKKSFFRRIGDSGSDWETKSEERVRVTLRILGNWEAWAKDLSHLYRGEPGAPGDWLSKQAVIELIELWERQTGKRPTLLTFPATGKKYGPFYEFCRDILSPVYAAHGLKCPSVGNLIQPHLYLSENSEDS